MEKYKVEPKITSKKESTVVMASAEAVAVVPPASAPVPVAAVPVADASIPVAAVPVAEAPVAVGAQAVEPSTLKRKRMRLIARDF